MFGLFAQSMFVATRTSPLSKAVNSSELDSLMHTDRRAAAPAEKKKAKS